jgi:DNA-binding phage protein
MSSATNIGNLMAEAESHYRDASLYFDAANAATTNTRESAWDRLAAITQGEGDKAKERAHALVLDAVCAVAKGLRRHWLVASWRADARNFRVVYAEHKTERIWIVDGEGRADEVDSNPDPFPVGALLLAAVAAYRDRTGASESDVARLAGLTPGNLHKALRNADTRPSTVRAICRALGLRVALVPAS